MWTDLKSISLHDEGGLWLCARISPFSLCVNIVRDTALFLEPASVAVSETLDRLGEEKIRGGEDRGRRKKIEGGKERKKSKNGRG